MKKSTGIVFLVVVVLAVVTYFREWKGHPGADQSDNPNTVTMAFKRIDENQIDQIQLIRAGMTMVFERKDDGWWVTQPTMTRADQSAVGDIAHTISELPSDRTLQATPQQVNDYGLANPAMTIEFKLQNGATHTMAIGGKDFSGLEVYSRIDGSKDVTLVSNVTSNAADKPFDDFRDHTVLMFPSQFEVTAMDLKNGSGEISAKKEGADWQIVKPVASTGDAGAIATLLGDVSGAKVARFISDDAQNVPRATLAQYGLIDPAIRLDLSLASGKPADLLIGKKDGLEYYAMDTGRSMIFRVPDDLVTKLNQQKLSDLQAKVLFTGVDTDVAQVQVQNASGTTKCARDSNGTLVVEQAAGQKGQAQDCPDILTPLQRAQANKVEDQPSADLRAKLAKPAIVITLTQANLADQPVPVSQGNPATQGSRPGKTTEIQISAPSGNTVYARSSNGPVVYEFDRAAFDALFDALKANSSASAATSAATK